MTSLPRGDLPADRSVAETSVGGATLVPLADDPWQQLRKFTDARIALGRTGASLPTDAHLAFQLAHARARDAVHLPLDVPLLMQALQQACGAAVVARSMVLDSAAGDRLTYLQRPDLGRRLSEESRNSVEDHRGSVPATGYDLALVIGDGLSAHAVAEHAAPFVHALLQRLQPENWSLAPLTIVRQARVAIGDEVGQLLGANMVVMLIGERPGLSSPDSMGLYLTWMPQVGLTDASRNCISNIRPAGLDIDSAAARLHYLLSEARRRQISGVQLKDETDAHGAVPGSSISSFLLPGPRD